MLLIVQVPRDLMTSNENNPKEATQACIFFFCLAIIITRNTLFPGSKTRVPVYHFSQMQGVVIIYYISIIVTMRALEKANLGCALECILHLCAYFINTYQFCV